jgi:lysyl-tRNA synthetase class 2
MSYPGFNHLWKKGGRIQALRFDGPSIFVSIEGQEHQLKYHPDFENLKVHDWVVWDEQGHLKIVAPSRRPPSALPLQIQNIKMWSQFLQLIRSFFINREFLELQTPTLVTCPGTEPTLDVFVSELKTGTRTQKVFLPTSPEIHLKKALAYGLGSIFEIAKCYRNNEITPLHQPEFWMLEWYRSFANLNDLQVDVVQLVHYLCDAFKIARPGVQCFSIPQLFQKQVHFVLRPDVTRQELFELCRSQNLKVDEGYSIDDLFFLLMIEKIEPSLPQDQLVFVEKYPPFQAALARRGFDGWAERFELYWKGFELANAFDELNDPIEQRERAREDLTKREGRTPLSLDEDFFLALESGMPPSAGLALGLERLFLALFNLRDLNEIRLFPVRAY